MGDVRTADRMDGNAFPSRNVADNALAANGVTTSRAINQHVTLTLDGYGVVIAEDATHHAGDAARLSLFPGIAGMIALAPALGDGGRTGRKKARQYLPGGIFSITYS